MKVKASLKDIMNAEGGKFIITQCMDGSINSTTIKRFEEDNNLIKVTKVLLDYVNNKAVII